MGLDGATRASLWYRERRREPPHFWAALPVQGKLQSARGAAEERGATSRPQKHSRLYSVPKYGQAAQSPAHFCRVMSSPAKAPEFKARPVGGSAQQDTKLKLPTGGRAGVVVGGAAVLVVDDEVELFEDEETVEVVKVDETVEDEDDEDDEVEVELEVEVLVDEELVVDVLEVEVLPVGTGGPPAK